MPYLRFSLAISLLRDLPVPGDIVESAASPSEQFHVNFQNIHRIVLTAVLYSFIKQYQKAGRFFRVRPFLSLSYLISHYHIILI